MKNKSKIKPLIGIALVVALAAAGFLLLDGADAVAAEELSAGEIPVSMESMEITRGELQAELCIEMPTLDPQWFPEGSLIVDGKPVGEGGWRLIGAKDPDVMKTARRCYLFHFPLTEEQRAAGTATLKLENVSREIEGGLLSEAGEAAAKERLQKEHPEIEFEVIIVHGEGGGGAYVDFLSKPEGMSEEEALRLVRAAAEEELPVGWEAEIDL